MRRRAQHPLAGRIVRLVAPGLRDLHMARARVVTVDVYGGWLWVTIDDGRPFAWLPDRVAAQLEAL